MRRLCECAFLENTHIMEDLASAVVEQLRTGDGPAKHWLLSRVHVESYSQCFFAAIVPEVRDGKKRYVVELTQRYSLTDRPYSADSKHVFETALDAATFFCAHAEGVRRERGAWGGERAPNCSLELGVVDPAQTTKLFEAHELTTDADIPALNAPTLRAHCREPAQIAAMLEAVEKQL